MILVSAVLFVCLIDFNVNCLILGCCYIERNTPEQSRTVVKQHYEQERTLSRVENLVSEVKQRKEYSQKCFILVSLACFNHKCIYKQVLVIVIADHQLSGL